jgi:hypothetical protein
MAKRQSAAEKEGRGGWVAIIQAVQTPIGFLTLVVLVLDGVLSAVAVIKSAPVGVLYTALGILVLMILLVVLLAAFRPEALRGARTVNIDQVAEQRDRALAERDQARAESETLRAEVVTTNAAFLILQRERDNVLIFVAGILDKLVSDRLEGRTGIGHFQQFLEAFLRTLLVFFFEDGEYLQRFRGAFYQLTDDHHELTYLYGVWPNVVGIRYTRDTLSESSLAMAAVRDGRVKLFPKDRAEGFDERPAIRPYRSFVAVPVPYNASESPPIGALCIDCLDEVKRFEEENVVALLAIAANLLHEAMRSYGVT